MYNTVTYHWLTIFFAFKVILLELTLGLPLFSPRTYPFKSWRYLIRKEIIAQKTLNISYNVHCTWIVLITKRLMYPEIVQIRIVKLNIFWETAKKCSFNKGFKTETTCLILLINNIYQNKCIKRPEHWTYLSSACDVIQCF